MTAGPDEHLLEPALPYDMKPRVARAKNSVLRSWAEPPLGGRAAITISSRSASSFTAKSRMSSLLRKYL